MKLVNTFPALFFKYGADQITMCVLVHRQYFVCFLKTAKIKQHFFNYIKKYPHGFINPRRKCCKCLLKMDGVKKVQQQEFQSKTSCLLETIL